MVLSPRLFNVQALLNIAHLLQDDLNHTMLASES